MKKLTLIFISLMFLSASAIAQESAKRGVSVGYGQDKDNIEIYRVGLINSWKSQRFKSRIGYVSGYSELSYNHWKGRRNTTHAIAFSPVFQYVFNPIGNNWYPYLEAGIGLAYLDDSEIDDRDLASNLEFEDRFGMGLRSKNWDLNFRYMHYSNASLKEPNEGIDIMIGTASWYF